jgi:hypothetical protein
MLKSDPSQSLAFDTPCGCGCRGMAPRWNTCAAVSVLAARLLRRCCDSATRTSARLPTLCLSCHRAVQQMVAAVNQLGRSGRAECREAWLLRLKHLSDDLNPSGCDRPQQMAWNRGLPAKRCAGWSLISSLPISDETGYGDGAPGACAKSNQRAGPALVRAHSHCIANHASTDARGASVAGSRLNASGGPVCGSTHVACARWS